MDTFSCLRVAGHVASHEPELHTHKDDQRDLSEERRARVAVSQATTSAILSFGPIMLTPTPTLSVVLPRLDLLHPPARPIVFRVVEYHARR